MISKYTNPLQQEGLEQLTHKSRFKKKRKKKVEEEEKKKDGRNGKRDVFYSMTP